METNSSPGDMFPQQLSTLIADCDKFQSELQSSSSLGSEELRSKAVRDEEERQLAAAKKASLAPPLHGHAESLSFKFWSTGRLEVEDRLSDCFYVIHGSYQNDLKSPHPFADIATLRSLPSGEEDDLREVCIFDNDKDDGLLVIQESAAEAMASAVYEGYEACVRALAVVVSNHMGGTAATAEQQEELLRKWARSSIAIKQARGSPIVLAAQLEAAGAAHRALLFKFLADASNVPCTLIGKQCINGREAEATAVVRIGGQLRAVDLIAEPGHLFRWPLGERGSSLRGFSKEMLTEDLIAEGAPTLNEISKPDTCEWRKDFETLPIQAASGTHSSEHRHNLGSTSQNLETAASSESEIAAKQPPQQAHAPIDELKAEARSGQERSAPFCTPPQEESNIVQAVVHPQGSPLPSKRFFGDSRRALAAAARGSARASGSNAVTSSFTSPSSSSFTAAGYRSGGASPFPGAHVERSSSSLSNACWSTRAEAAALAEQSLPPRLRKDPGSFAFKNGSMLSSHLALRADKKPPPINAYQRSLIESLSQSLPDQSLKEDCGEAHHDSHHHSHKCDASTLHTPDSSEALLKPGLHQQHQHQPLSSLLTTSEPALNSSSVQAMPPALSNGTQSNTHSGIHSGILSGMQSRGTRGPLSRSEPPDFLVPTPGTRQKQQSLVSLTATEQSWGSASDKFAQAFGSAPSHSSLPPSPLLSSQPSQPSQQQSLGIGASRAVDGSADATSDDAVLPLRVPLQSEDLTLQRKKDERRCLLVTTMESHDSSTPALLQRTAVRKPPSVASLAGLVRSRSADDIQLPRSSSQPPAPLYDADAAHLTLVPAWQDRNDDDEWEIDASEVLMGPRIGVGSFGEVYRGSWRHTDVAVKRLLEQDVQETVVEEFRREVAIMKKLRHPCIVQFLGACTKQPHLCIISAFVARGSLFRLLHRSKSPVQIDEKRRLLMALDIARGMHYLHTCRPPVVHCDLKSPNLLVDKDFTIKVADFGLSRARWTAWMASSSRTGTPEWCAPEVLRSERTNEKSDVWSFGVVLWELATGLEPWAEQSAVQVVGAVGWGGATLDIPPATNPGLADIIRSCWQEPHLRPSFDDLITSIRDLASSRGLMGPQAREGSGPHLQPLAPSRQTSVDGQHSSAISAVLPPRLDVVSNAVSVDNDFLRRAFTAQGRQNERREAPVPTSPPGEPHAIEGLLLSLSSPSAMEGTDISAPTAPSLSHPLSSNAAGTRTWSVEVEGHPGAAHLRGGTASIGGEGERKDGGYHPLQQEPGLCAAPDASSTDHTAPVGKDAAEHSTAQLRGHRHTSSNDGSQTASQKPPHMSSRPLDAGHLSGNPSLTKALSMSPDSWRTLPAAAATTFARTTSVPIDGRGSRVGAEPSARRLAAQAARVASTKLTRGLTQGLKELANGIQTAKNTLVGAAVPKTPPRSVSSHESLVPQNSDVPTPDSGSGMGWGPFTSITMGGRRTSEASSVLEQLSLVSSSEMEPMGSSHSSFSLTSQRGSGVLPAEGLCGGQGVSRCDAITRRSLSNRSSLDSQQDTGSPVNTHSRSPSSIPSQQMFLALRKLSHISEDASRHSIDANSSQLPNKLANVQL